MLIGGVGRCGWAAAAARRRQRGGANSGGPGTDCLALICDMGPNGMCCTHN